MNESGREIPPTVPFRPGVQRDGGLERIPPSGPTGLEQRNALLEQRVAKLEKRVEYILDEMKLFIKGRKP